VIKEYPDGMTVGDLRELLQESDWPDTGEVWFASKPGRSSIVTEASNLGNNDLFLGDKDSPPRQPVEEVPGRLYAGGAPNLGRRQPKCIVGPAEATIEEALEGLEKHGLDVQEGLQVLYPVPEDVQELEADRCVLIIKIKCSNLGRLRGPVARLLEVDTRDAEGRLKRKKRLVDDLEKAVESLESYAQLYKVLWALTS